MERRELLSEGNVKQVYATDDKEMVIIHYKDTIGAFNNIKRATIKDKGILNNNISAFIYEYLNAHGIRTEFIRKLNSRDQLCRKVELIPLEFIVRNRIAGSLSARLHIEEGKRTENTIFDLSYKNEEFGDPLINDHHAVALGLVTYEELEKIYEDLRRLNECLKQMFLKAGIELIDFKIEYGHTLSGEIVLADEITPDTCRLWDVQTGYKLDKDRFRHDLGHIMDAYKEVQDRLYAIKE